MKHDVYRPPRWRIISGFLIAPLIAAAALACFQPAYAGLADMSERLIKTMAAYCVFAYPTAVVVGVPAFFFLRPRLHPTLLNCVLAGAGVAATPWLILVILSSPASFMKSGGHIEIIDGHRTIWWWVNGMGMVLEVAAVGLLGGLSFWLVTAARPVKRQDGSA